MQTAKPVSTKEATEIIVKNLDRTYIKAYIEHVASNAVQLNAEERTKLIALIKEFDDLFDGTLGEWDTKTIDLELMPDSKLFDFKYYPAPIINKEAFCKDLQL